MKNPGGLFFLADFEKKYACIKDIKYAWILKKNTCPGVLRQDFLNSVTFSLGIRLDSRWIPSRIFVRVQTNPWHHEEKPHNNQETLERQTKQSNRLSLPHQVDCKTRMDIK